MCLFVLSSQAQRCAVLEFKAGAGISQRDVDGISSIFITYFHPSGYTMVERTQIDRVIYEQRFQRSSLTESQMVRVGQILNVSKIVAGTVNIVMGQYNVDVRVINVESGTVAATEGATFASSSYRTGMQDVAEKLSAKIAITPRRNTTPVERTEPYIIYGYLKVFPKDLGVYDSEPQAAIAQLNQSQKYGYGSWRLPTNEELALMRSQNIIGNGNYMTKENHRGIVRLVTDRGKIPAGYVDLGLPSGTLWRNQDENGTYSNDDAVKYFGNKLPTKEQFQELLDHCQWTWTGKECKVTGPNHNYIILSAKGYRDCSGRLLDGDGCYYWSSSPSGGGTAYRLKATSNNQSVGGYFGCNGHSVRLVQNK